MKQIILILSLFVIFCACEEEIDTYSGECGIYFDASDLLLDTVSISWGLKNSEITEQTVALKVRLFGDVATYDREFSIEIVSDADDTLRAREGVDYRPFGTGYVIPALQAEATINIQLLRTEILQKQGRRFTVKLKETPELQFLYSRQTFIDSVTTRQVDIQRVIYMDENFPQPKWWSSLGKNIFGEFSIKKSILICDELEIDREIWVGDLIGSFTKGYLNFAGQYMHRWLQENPTLDENGELMQMGPASQK